ncbi:hypothetical protein JZU46_04895 [bacterium]|jgi:hypothetical protein|nr:hypothetical protein [bacterium]
MATTTGLQLYPRTREDSNVISSIIEDSDFYAEYNSQYGFFFFPEEEENYDDLEWQLDELFSDKNVNYRIEGIF